MRPALRTASQPAASKQPSGPEARTQAAGARSLHACHGQRPRVMRLGSTSWQRTCGEALGGALGQHVLRGHSAGAAAVRAARQAARAAQRGQPCLCAAGKATTAGGMPHSQRERRALAGSLARGTVSGTRTPPGAVEAAHSDGPRVRAPLTSRTSWGPLRCTTRWPPRRARCGRSSAATA